MTRTSKKPQNLTEKNVSLFESGLTKAFARHFGNNFTVYSDPPTDISSFDAVFICVGTPCDEMGRADLRYIYGALDMLNLQLEQFGGVVVIKSTVPPDTAKTKIIPHLRGKGITAPVVSNPEFLREGCCWKDFINPDRIVCGVDNQRAADVMKSIYRDFDAPVIVTSLNTAEFIKYLSNNMLASMISFSNEMSMIAKEIGDISIKQAFETLHMDRRWNSAPMKSYVYPGCGFGGDCLPKDLQAMISHARSYDISPTLLQSVLAVNNKMTDFFVGQVTADVTENIGILGLSFKYGSDDVRFSPAAGIISALLDKGYRHIYAYDPVANSAFRDNYDFQINYCGSIEEVCKKANTVIITTAWPEFKKANDFFPEVCFIDGRYIL